MFGSLDSRKKPTGSGIFRNVLQLFIGYAGDQGGGEKLQVLGDIYLSGKVKAAATPYLDVYCGVGTTPLAGATPTQIPYDTVTTDNLGWWNAGTKRYTPLAAGRYRVTLGCFISGSAAIVVNSSLMELYIRKNGVTSGRKIIRAQVAISSAMGWADQVTMDLVMNGSTDYIDGAVYTDATSFNINGNNASHAIDTFMQISYVGPN